MVVKIEVSLPPYTANNIIHKRNNTQVFSTKEKYDSIENPQKVSLHLCLSDFFANHLLRKYTVLTIDRAASAISNPKILFASGGTGIYTHAHQGIDYQSTVIFNRILLARSATPPKLKSMYPTPIPIQLSFTPASPLDNQKTTNLLL
jgi:hypothetical protein